MRRSLIDDGLRNRLSAHAQGGDCRIDDRSWQQVVEFVQLRDGAGLAELVDAERHARLPERRPQPGQGVRRRVMDRDDRRRAGEGDAQWARDRREGGRPDSLAERLLPGRIEPVRRGDVDDMGGDAFVGQLGRRAENLGQDGSGGRQVDDRRAARGEVAGIDQPEAPASTWRRSTASPSRARAASNGAWSIGRVVSLK